VVVVVDGSVAVVVVLGTGVDGGDVAVVVAALSPLSLHAAMTTAAPATRNIRREIGSIPAVCLAVV